MKDGLIDVLHRRQKIGVQHRAHELCRVVTACGAECEMRVATAVEVELLLRLVVSEELRAIDAGAWKVLVSDGRSEVLFGRHPQECFLRVTTVHERSEERLECRLDGRPAGFPGLGPFLFAGLSIDLLGHPHEAVFEIYASHLEGPQLRLPEAQVDRDGVEHAPVHRHPAAREEIPHLPRPERRHAPVSALDRPLDFLRWIVLSHVERRGGRVERIGMPSIGMGRVGEQLRDETP